MIDQKSKILVVTFSLMLALTFIFCAYKFLIKRDFIVESEQPLLDEDVKDLDSNTEVLVPPLEK